MNHSETTPPLVDVEKRFHHLRKNIRTLFLGDGLSRWILVLGLFISISFTLDYLLNLPAPVRLILLSSGLIFCGLVVWRRILRPLQVPITDEDIALFVERQNPGLEDRLISAIQLSRSGTDGKDHSPELVKALVKEAEEYSQKIDFRSVLIYRNVVRIGTLALVLVLFFTGLVSLDYRYGSDHWGGQLTPIYLNRLVGGAAAWPKKIQLKVLDFTDGRRVIARGEDLVVAVRAEKQRAGVSAPSTLSLKYRFENGDEGEREVERVRDEVDLTWGDLLNQVRQGTLSSSQPEVTEGGDRYFFRFENVPASFTFFVEGGGDRTESYRVETRIPPTIQEISTDLLYPAYLRLPSKKRKEGHVSAPLHTVIQISALTNVPVEKGELLLGLKGSEVSFPLTLSEGEGGTWLSGEVKVTQTYSEYHFQLLGVNGLENRDPRRYRIQGVEDQPPRFKIIDPLAESEDVTDICARPLLFEVTDDYGLASIQMEYRVIGANETDWIVLSIPPELMGGEEGEKQQIGDTLIRVETLLDLKKTTLPGSTAEVPLRVKVGDHVRIRFRAQDYLDIGKPNESVSRVITLSVKSMAEIEKALQDEIARLRDILDVQLRKQRAQYNRAGRLNQKWSVVDTLVGEGKREIRGAKLEQNGIVDRLVSVRTDVRRVMNRGMYNRIFTKDSADKLQEAADVLTSMIGDPTRREKYGFALGAVQKLEEAGSSVSASERAMFFRTAQDLQGQTIAGIQKVLDLLKKWASYQEIIRAFREALDIQKSVIEGIRSK
ncbi:MAG: hypothetical protein QF645_01770 [Planctomycetota bacterium]|nr:hypothetical protein [Planctomycetota bacterium]